MVESFLKRAGRTGLRIGAEASGIADGWRTGEADQQEGLNPWDGRVSFTLAHYIAPATILGASWMNQSLAAKDDEKVKRTAMLTMGGLLLDTFGKVAVGSHFGWEGVFVSTGIEIATLALAGGIAAEIQDNGRRRVSTGTLPK